MKKAFLLMLGFFTFIFSASAKPPTDSTEFFEKLIDSINASYTYQTGKINIGEGIAVLNIPKGFKYMDGPQSEKVLYELWGNPRNGDQLLGMIFPETGGPMVSDTWAFVITFDKMGFVKDKDADKIKYDELLEGMKKEAVAANAERAKLGFESVSIVGWAAQPYYDKEKKVLYWAKEIHFGEDSVNTLNYDVRVLGRRGVLSLNAVATMNELSEVNKNKDQILAMVEYTEGNRYADFNSKTDDVAAWTIGGLVAGKLLAKVGFFALILKNIKLVILALLAVGAGIWRFISGRKKKEEEMTYVPSSTGETPGSSTPIP